MVASFTHVVFDASLSDAATQFWARALDAAWRSGSAVPGCAASLVPGQGDAYVHRAGQGSAAPALVLEVGDVEAATQRLIGRGATGSELLRSPGGLPFALGLAQTRLRAPAAHWPDGTRSRLVQLCLDCPADVADREAEFWAEATGWAWRDSDSPEFVGHLVPGSGSLQLLVQRRASPLPREVTLHLDLGADDREAEAARLVALGATRVGAGDGWIVLEDPDGRRFCATGQPPEAP